MSGRGDLIWFVLAICALGIGILLGVAGADVSPILTEAPTGITGGPGR